MLARSLRPLAAAVLGLAAAAGPLPLLAQPHEWQPQLNEQMLREYDCEVAFLSQVAERMVNGDLVVLAKVHCVDKRSFNAVRDSAFEPFEIHPCENPDNRVC
ncbi:MAG: hypothetical protein ACM35H_15415 [Bacteroidota bacterium]|nr:hypothetical protein [Kiloniellaceae bacterium]